MTFDISGPMTCASWRNFKQYSLPALGIVLLGFALRLHHLGGDSFWVDEIITVETARTLSGALAGGRSHPPLMYLFTHFSFQIWGESEFTARLPALWAGTLALPVMLVLGRRLHRPETGLWAAFLLALAPFHLKYAQEARHYAGLLLFTSLTFLFLHRALSRPGWKPWLLFALVSALNLYTHYTAFLVLAVQAMVIGGWVLFVAWRGRWGDMRYPLVAGIVVFLLFLPQLPHFIATLPRNVGAGTVTDTGQAGSLVEWGRNLLLAFGGGSSWLTILFPLLAVTGVWWLIRQRHRLELVILLAGMVGPLLLVPLFGVARGPFPRYLINLLPFYLLAASIPLVEFTRLLRRRSRPVAVAVSSLLILGFFLVSLPRLQNEYQFMVGDWRGIAGQLTGQPDRPVLALSLNFPNGYNIAAASLPYYLPPDQRLLAGNGQLRPADVDYLIAAPAVALVVHDWNPGNPLAGLAGPVTSFPTGLYVTEPAGPALSTAIEALQKLILQADVPVPQCLLRQDLAALQVAAGDVNAAAEAFTAAVSQCPELPAEADPEARRAVRRAIAAGLAERIVDATSPTQAEQAATRLIAIEPQHPLALETLTEFDLQAAWGTGGWQIQRESDTDPIRPESFTMPGGDPVATLLTHPPAELSYSLTLPVEPLLLTFRTAMAPRSWGWGGDGARLQVRLQPAGGESVLLYDEWITNALSDQTWHTGRISLADYAGQEVRLTLLTDPGPAGDFTGDWAGWADLRLIHDPEYLP